MKGTDSVETLATLAEPLRRRIYEHVVASAPESVSRDGTAQALAVARSVAAFHLDKLVDAGLLAVEYRRPEGRGGPGAGRPAKWYRRSEGETTVSVPERHYSLAARLLARAVERSVNDGMPVTKALCEVARQEGRRMASNLPEGPRPQVRLARLLADHGYEPRVRGRRITLGNCPFHLLANEHRDLVCTMNHQLLSGMASQAGLPKDAARLDPRQDRCCVVLTVGAGSAGDNSPVP